jgi:hypothetical protein
MFFRNILPFETIVHQPNVFYWKGRHLWYHSSYAFINSIEINHNGNDFVEIDMKDGIIIEVNCNHLENKKFSNIVSFVLWTNDGT